MTSTTTEEFPRRGLQLACLLLIGGQLLWLGQVVPRWIRGAAPAYPSQYQGRLLSVITGTGIMVAVLASQSASFKTPRGRFVYWFCLACAMASLAVQVIADR
jgi:hypothetical protein